MQRCSFAVCWWTWETWGIWCKGADSCRTARPPTNLYIYIFIVRCSTDTVFIGFSCFFYTFQFDGCLGGLRTPLSPIESSQLFLDISSLMQMGETMRNPHFIWRKMIARLGTFQRMWSSLLNARVMLEALVSRSQVKGFNHVVRCQRKHWLLLSLHQQCLFLSENMLCIPLIVYQV